MTSLNATDEAMFISARRQAMVVVNMTANKGIDVRESTYKVSVSIGTVKA